MLILSLSVEKLRRTVQHGELVFRRPERRLREHTQPVLIVVDSTVIVKEVDDVNVLDIIERPENEVEQERRLDFSFFFFFITLQKMWISFLIFFFRYTYYLKKIVRHISCF